MAERWFYQIMGQTFGPVSFSHLRDLATNGHLSPDDRIRAEGNADWILAESVPGMFPALSFAGPQQRETAFTFEEYESESVPPSHREPMPPVNLPAGYDMPSFEVERKYPALRFCAKLIRWEAAVVFILGTIAAVLLLVISFASDEPGLWDRIGLSLLVWFGVAVWCIVHVAGAESIMVWIDMEENGRRQNMLLRLLGKSA